jgi:hypothetical protein
VTGKAIRIAWILGAVLAALPSAALAQNSGQITGVVRDTSGAVMPGVLIEVASPALIEKVRSTTTGSDGQYRIINLPVGTYTVTFTLEGFTRQQRNDIVLTTGFTASVNAAMSVGQRTETVVVTAEAPTVDTQSSRQAITFQGTEIQELPTPRNVSSLLALTPGITSGYAPGTGSGVCVGGVGVFCNPGVPGFNVGDRDTDRAPGFFNLNCGGFNLAGSSSECDNSATNMQQGRVLIDGAVINSGSPAVIGGLTQGYIADIGNAQEISIQVSGALGESETGGASLNIVPRTGGNKFAGNYHTTYTRQSWFDNNGGAYATLTGFSQNINSLLHDYDVSVGVGGPIKKDHLWFYSVGRTQGKKAFPACCGNFYPNTAEAKWGYNYQPDYSQPSVTYKNAYKNGNARITWQATQKNKFNFFWDEQDFCQDPCYGVVSTFTSPESWWSVATYPNRLQQVSWTNPFTSKILLEAGLSITAQHYDTTHSRDFVNPQNIPAVTEWDVPPFAAPGTLGQGTAGLTVGTDGSGVILNSRPGRFGLTSGSLNAGANGGSELRDTDNYRSRASLSYVTGRHNAKFGFDGGYYTRKQTNNPNDLRLMYTYRAPSTGATPCTPSPTPPPAPAVWCGNTAVVNGVAQFPSELLNPRNRPWPESFTINTGPVTFDEWVNYSALYAQDQWTMKRLTINAALRYDHATSGYNPTCVGGGGSEPWVPVQNGGQYAGQRYYCTPKTEGVRYNDLTPRWGLTYDLFGNGRTSIKWSMGKYLDAAGLGGLYTGANPARRTVNTLTRNWRDDDADRALDCSDPLAAATNGECLTFPFFGADPVRYGRDPLSLDEAGQPVDLATTQCGRTEKGIPTAVVNYCNQYGDSLLDGWSRRQANWQLGLGIQHEILPRLSAELTYNRRKYLNLTVSDQLGIGCDRYATALGGSVPFNDCAQGYLDFTNPFYDFYSITAPTDPDLPRGGGYRVVGLNSYDPTKGAAPTANPRAVSYMDTLNYTYNGFDTNFVWRGPGGLRLNGGTSTGRTSRDTCSSEVDGPNVRGRLSSNDASNIDGDSDYVASCHSFAPWQTRVNGTAAYTIPKIDVLVSTVFQSFPGIARSANFTIPKEQVIWNPESADRATFPCAAPGTGVGCVGNSNSNNTVSVNLLNRNELWGERTTTFDLKVAKNIRLRSKRVTFGVDVYNLFNSDAIQDYEDAFVPDNPATPQDESATWGTPQSVITPRFLRISLDFFF